MTTVADGLVAEAREEQGLDVVLERARPTVEIEPLDFGRSEDWWRARIEDQLERREQRHIDAVKRT